MAQNAEQRLDALWSDDEAYSYIEALFNNEDFVSVAQEKVLNHGDPIDVREFENNFGNIMERWSKKLPVSFDNLR